MTLLIDAGNTRVKLGWRDAQGRREPRATAIARDTLGLALPGWLAALAPRVRGALGVNAAGAACAAQIDACLAEAGLAPVRWERARAHCAGLANQYRDPERLGADRWAALLGLAAGAASRPYRGMVRVLATFGTATTIDTLTPDERFEGGLILPGVDLMLQSLAKGTADLPLAQGRPVAFPDHTDAAIVSGVMAAQAGALLRQWLAAGRRSEGVPAQLFVSGGAWHAVREEWQALAAAAGIAAEPQVLDNPVLDGLAVLAGLG
ncbi:type III pantothenate kinase [Verticiella sediminum]|uniref:Type III pantothenate kinase n=1 Tax=Verticiella sediminum TaxID=1247510 RepID=A0A556AMW8_9BURK|nr:type III pantothenate kinase [Verticiella sediminum]TSH94229.1 type III pantothenate kinase [Verticiella sediminum]